jgi:hypothetical protein
MDFRLVIISLVKVKMWLCAAPNPLTLYDMHRGKKLGALRGKSGDQLEVAISSGVKGQMDRNLIGYLF